ncbi:MAG: malic enzyme-like NAD(P)-binding protein, partial [Thiobacillus sp.]|nr:malic enzyme-like NAD(P)-binding protein [Thiobacillus sp.]
NQVNNVLGFPFIFRGALDARAKQITEAMLIAAVHALAGLAREPVPAAVLKAYKLTKLKFGPDYILPKPFDPRLAQRVPQAVAKAAMVKVKKTADKKAVVKKTTVKKVVAKKTTAKKATVKKTVAKKSPAPTRRR